MNTDALVTLSKAVASLPPQYRLYWYPISGIPLDYLTSEGFDTSRIVMRVVSTADMRRELTEASVLVAPLSFKNCSTAEVKTVFSNKLLTYLITGRPILVYGPSDSYHVGSAAARGWGWVVSHDDADLLAESIRSLAENPALQEELVEQGFGEARRRRSSLIAADLGAWVQHDAPNEHLGGSGHCHDSK
jgi:glycosyltransferase involved in cell wall biosynthesis